MLVLGIESSCDETAAALVRDGREMLSSVISSQVDIHKKYGGVVPELASREHLDKIVPVVEEAFARAGLGKEEIDGVAVTRGPGLVGSLLVGLSFAKAFAYALEKPFVGVNHIEGHIYSVVFDNPPIEYPAFALVVSGGHTNLFLVPEPGRYRGLAREGDPRAVKFSLPRMGDGLPDFSFSGLKTAVSKHVRETGLKPVAEGEEPSQAIKDLAASFQSVVIRSLVGTTERLAEEHKPRTLILAGGVACNMALRAASEEAGARLGIP